MAKPNYQAGGSFLPGYPARVTSTDPWNFDVSPTVGTDTGQGAQTLVTNTATQTLTNKTLTAPIIQGAATLASGATLTTPAIAFTSLDVTATGTTGSTAANLGTVFPAIYTITGAANSGVNLPTGTPGAFAVLNNEVAGTIKVYAVGSTINGTTGTTAVSITNTGNKTALAYCTTAGAWFVLMNT